MELSKNKKHHYLFFFILSVYTIFNGGNSNLLIQINFILISLFFLTCLKDKNYNLHFENFYKNNKPLPVVRPGSQSRRFTHIYDTVKICYLAWKINKCRHYSISNKKSYTILGVAKLFNSKIKFLPRRKGERYASALTSMSLSKKVHKMFGKINLKNYIKNFIYTNK